MDGNREFPQPVDIRKQYLKVNLDSIDEEENDHDEHKDSIAAVEHVGEEPLQKIESRIRSISIYQCQRDAYGHL